MLRQVCPGHYGEVLRTVGGSTTMLSYETRHITMFAILASAHSLSFVLSVSVGLSIFPWPCKITAKCTTNVDENTRFQILEGHVDLIHTTEVQSLSYKFKFLLPRYFFVVILAQAISSRKM